MFNTGIEFKKSTLYGEAMSKGMQYVFLDNNLNPITEPMTCKDYLQDLFWAHHNNSFDSIVFGFKVKKDDFPTILEQEKYHIVLGQCGCDFIVGEKINNLVSFINSIEVACNVPISIIEQVDDGKNLLISFDKWWTSKPYLLSMYCLFLRVGVNFTEDKDVEEFIKNPQSTCGSDVSYLNSAFAVLDMEELPEQSWKEYKSMNSAHGESGISNFYNKIKATIKPKVECSVSI